MLKTLVTQQAVDSLAHALRADVRLVTVSGMRDRLVGGICAPEIATNLSTWRDEDPATCNRGARGVTTWAIRRTPAAQFFTEALCFALGSTTPRRSRHD